MRVLVSVLALVLALVVVSGCRGGSGGASAGANAGGAGGADDAACWPVQPMVLEALEHGAEWEPISAIEADGSVVHLAKGRRAMGRLEGDRFVAGKSTLTCDAERRLSVPGLSAAGGYDAEGAFVEKGVRILVTDDGTVLMTHHGKTVFGPGDGQGHARVRGAHGGGRRTAALLVLLSLGGPPG